MSDLLNLSIQIWCEWIGAEPGDTRSTLLTAIILVVTILLGALLAATLLKGNRGFFVNGIGMLLPALVFILCFTLAQHYLSPELEGTVLSIAKWSAAAVGFLLLGVLFTKIIMGVSWGGALFVLILTYSATFGGVLLADALINSFATSARSVEAGKERSRLPE